MKFAEELFPKGTFERQASDGAYIDAQLASNLNTYAKKIVQDMHFLLIISGNDSVGNGKSTQATHIATYITWKVNQLHGTKNTFTHENMVFKSKDLVKRSFELPKYSVIVLDEGDDLTWHGMKTTAQDLKKYFRKCRQLNQILILILPSFFELPKFYALSRSHALINVKFQGEFDRGYFDFYGPKAKKKLYLFGKKDWNYEVIKSDFSGRFFSSYTFFPNLKAEIQKYRDAKYQDMLDDDKDTKHITPGEVEKRTKIAIFQMLLKNLPDMTPKELGKLFQISDPTAYRWARGDVKEIYEEIL